MNKQQQPDSSIHDTSAHCSRVYQVFNLLSLTVPEKSETKNFNLKGDGMTEGQGNSSIAPTFSKRGYN